MIRSQIGRMRRECKRLEKLPDSQLQGQPFDDYLLKKSKLFSKSRELFLSQGGRHIPSLLSSPRSLGSGALLQNQIEYSPLEREFRWTATDRIEKKSDERILLLRTYVTNLYHEQNHRILWNFLPRLKKSELQKDKTLIHRYLNFVEALVITLDMALGDELGPKRSDFFYISGILYDPGTTVRARNRLNSRGYRNYLQASLYATYLTLQGYKKTQILKLCEFLFPRLERLNRDAVERSYRLDPQFVRRTNPVWQFRHMKRVSQFVCSDGSGHSSTKLSISENPEQNHVLYYWAEKCFDYFGIK